MRVYAANSDPLDFCRTCARSMTETKALRLYGPDSDYDPTGTQDMIEERGCDAFGHDCDHPDYSDTDYDCDQCGRPLKDSD